MEDMPIFIHNDFEVVDDITTRCNNIRPSSGDVPVIVVQYPKWKYETSCFLDKVWYYFSALLKRAKNLRFVQHGREYCILLADEVLGRSFSVHIRHETAPAARHFRIHLSLLTSKERKRVEDFSEAERLSMQMALMEVFDLVDEAARQVDFSINTRWSVIERGASMADAVVDRFYTCSSSLTRAAPSTASARSRIQSHFLLHLHLLLEEKEMKMKKRYLLLSHKI